MGVERDATQPSALDVLAGRVRRVPEALEATLAAPECALDEAWWARAQVVVTGVGLAAGPARAAAGMLASVGVPARFEPLSAFACGAPRGQALCVFSQGLSPNARLAMSRVGAYERGLLVTSERVTSREEGAHDRALGRWLEAGGRVWGLPPDEVEGGMLLRVIAPICASLGAARLAARLGRARGVHAGWFDELERVPERYARALAAPVLPPRGDRSLALVTVGSSGALAHGLMWKVMEALWREPPMCVDVMDFAHGPLQALEGRSALVLAMHAPGQAPDALVGRLGEVLGSAHELARVRAEGSGPLAHFEFDAALNAWVCEELRGFAGDLGEWPAKGRDEALYGLRTAPDA
jgi:hypothetical protein